MSTFAQMEARIISELHRDDIASVVDDYINDAINHYQRFRFWFNEKSQTLPTVADRERYDWPVDFVQLDSLVITSNGNSSPLRQVSSREMDELQGGTSKGQPYCFAMYGQEYRLYPIPDRVYTLTQYYLFTDPLVPFPSGSNGSNVWTTLAEELIRTRAKKLLVGQFMPTGETMQWAAMLDKQESDLFRGLQLQTQEATKTGRLRSWDA